MPPKPLICKNKISKFAFVGNTHIISCDVDSNLYVWDLSTSEYKSTIASGHPDRSITLIEVSSDGSKFVTASSDKTIRVWSLYPCLKLDKVLTRHQEEVIQATFCQNNTKIRSGSKDGLVLMWDVETGCLEDIVDVTPETPPNISWYGGITGVCGFRNPKGNLITCFIEGGKVTLTNTKNKYFATFQLGGYVQLTSLDVVEKNIWILGHDGKVRIWNLETNEFLKKIRLEKSYCLIRGMSKSSNQEYMALSCPRHIQIYSTRTLECVKTIPHNDLWDGGGDIRWMPDGKMMAMQMDGHNELRFFEFDL